ncbi:MAG TPA: FAD-dependent oxidoreductase, partial [Mycobacteriales bacterium]|nr:FAD-dependent oxidoreductase [Mycobacteriales bacterium]
MAETELVIYAATSAGVCAAVAAAEAGVQVMLIEPGRHVGGMTSGGLGYTDMGDARVVGGFAGRLRRDIADHYGVSPGAYAGPEPHVAERIYLRWLEEAGVRVVFGEPLREVTMTGTTIDAVVTASGSRFAAGLFIDASYEGDLLALAGVP